MTKLGRKPAIVAFVVLALVLASGTGAAQSATTAIDHQGSATVNDQIDAEHGSSANGEASVHEGDLVAAEACPPEHACTAETSGQPVEASYDAEAYVDVSLDVIGELEDLPEVELPESEDETNETPEEEADEETNETDAPSEDEHAEIDEGFYAAYDGNASLDTNASTHTDVRYNGDHAFEFPENETPAENAEPEEEAEEDKPSSDDTPANAALDLSAAAQAFLRGCRDAEHEATLELPTQVDMADDVEAGPIDHTVSTDDGVRFDLRGAFQASTSGFTAAASQLGATLEQLVDQVKSVFQAETKAVTKTESSIELIGSQEGSVDAAAEVTSTVDEIVADIELPEASIPTADVRSDSSASSKTTVSSGLTGDIGLGL